MPANTLVDAKHKGLCIQLTLALFVICHACVGGALFAYFEYEPEQKVKRDLIKQIEDCLAEQVNNSTDRDNWNAQEAVKICVEAHVGYLEWSYKNSIIFSFTVMATHGYGEFMPHSSAGRAICIFFALIGIPLCMLLYANIGAHMRESVVRLMEKFRDRKNVTPPAAANDDDDRSTNSDDDIEPAELQGWMILVWFLGYVTFGAILLALTNPKMGYMGAMYNTFTALTGGDVKPLTDGRGVFLPFKMIYASVGLGIALIAMDMGSEHLKKIHNFGKTIKNAANAFVWFGGNKVSVRNLVRAVGRKCGIDRNVIDSLNLNHIAKVAIMEQAGLLTNPIPKAYVPDMIAYINYMDDDTDEHWITEAAVDRLLHARHEARMARQVLDQLLGEQCRKFGELGRRISRASRQSVPSILVDSPPSPPWTKLFYQRKSNGPLLAPTAATEMSDLTATKSTPSLPAISEKDESEDEPSVEEPLITTSDTTMAGPQQSLYQRFLADKLIETEDTSSSPTHSTNTETGIENLPFFDDTEETASEISIKYF